jgi:hypothetical protein
MVKQNTYPFSKYKEDWETEYLKISPVQNIMFCLPDPLSGVCYLFLQ